MIKEHERIAITTDIPSLGLRKGDIGTVVMVHRDGEGFEVEFITLQGDTIGVETLRSSQVRSIKRNEIAKARMVRV